MSAYSLPIPTLIRRAFGLPLLLVVLGACDETTVTAPGEPSLAREPGAPAVKSTDPTSAPRNTTLTVRVLGSGFQPDAQAVWALDGDTAFATTRIQTNTTEYVSSRELRASITIESDAELELFDVLAINSNGKKGIGIELFAVTIEILDLGAGSPGTAQAVNDGGQIVGESGDGRAFLWSAGVLTDLGLPPGMTHSVAYDINETGVIVVSASAGPGTSRAFLWSEGTFDELPPPAGYCCSQAYALNDAGEVAGAVWVAQSEDPHAAIWRNRLPTDLQASSGGEGYAWDINNLGEVVGTYYSGTGGPQGSFRWSQSSGLQLLGGSADNGEALGINDNGQIVGWSLPAPGQQLVAYVWQGGSRQFLGTLGGPGSVAMAITEDGQIVGRADLSRKRGALPQAAFLWTAGEGMKNLGASPSFDIGWAHDANSVGVIVGQMSNTRGGSQQATRWTLR